MSKSKINPLKLPHHPLCTLFPPMGDEAYKALLKSIKTNGYDPSDPITTYQGQILDGAHRQTACQKLKVTPTTKEFTGDDPYEFVVQKNLARRHLTPAQATAAAADLALAIREAEKADREAAKAAKAAEKAAEKGKAGNKKPAVKKTRTPAKGSTAKRAAKALGVSERGVAAAIALKESDPESFEAVKKGQMSVDAASKKASEKKSAADRKTDAFNAACANIAAIVGEDFIERVKNKVKAKDLIQMSGLIPDEMKRIAPHIEMGWAYKMALGYKSVTLTPAHQIRVGLDRAFSQGGRHTMDGAAYGKNYMVEFTFPEMLNPA